MHVPVVIVGAGPGGLAMSRHLVGAGVDHVVLERGEVGNSWRHERWDSLRLLTPNWMMALPGHRYDGPEPDGFMSAAQTVAFLDAYRRRFDPPVRAGVTVTSVRRAGDGFEVRADGGCWRCEVVVAATGASSEPRVPPLAAEMPAGIEQLTALEYRRPAQLGGDGAVLVVGASASGVQIADELRRAGREVTISAGEHVRLPRNYRGRDIYWWMDRIGQLDERYDEVDDVERARRHASVQLVGSDDHRDLDLNTLHAAGVQVVGRLMAVRGGTGLCSGALANLAKNADLKQARLLRRIDDYVRAHGGDGATGEQPDPSPTALGDPPTELALCDYSTVVWATGYRPGYRWLTADAKDGKARVVHDGGVARLPGLYLLGLPFLRRRRSNLVSGLGVDAAELFVHLRSHLDRRARGRAGRRAPSPPAVTPV
ncbi:MAG TPA: NAD(P)-binding domain-containing protein [Acidimicrobiia bacterium]|nr:NAD(P)-binding domain-containing protein [Acidimicrobiia bacterium]